MRQKTSDYLSIKCLLSEVSKLLLSEAFCYKQDGNFKMLIQIYIYIYKNNTKK